MLREVQLDIRIEEVDMYEGTTVKVLLDSRAMDVYEQEDGKRTWFQVAESKKTTCNKKYKQNKEQLEKHYTPSRGQHVL